MSRPAVAAEVVVASISVPDFAAREEDGRLEQIWLRVAGSWAFTSKTDVEPTGVRLDLLVSPPEQNGSMNFDRLDRVEVNVQGFDANGSYELLGEVTSHGGLPPEHFAAPDAGTTTQRTVHVRVVFSVLDGDAVLGEAVAEDSAVVSVENSSTALEVGVDGQGQFEVVADAGDPTPTRTA